MPTTKALITEARSPINGSFGDLTKLIHALANRLETIQTRANERRRTILFQQRRFKEIWDEGHAAGQGSMLHGAGGNPISNPYEKKR